MSNNLSILPYIKQRHNMQNVSNRYGFVDSMQVLDSLSDYLDLDSARVKTSKRKGTQHAITLDLKSKTEIVIGGDVNKVQVHLLNSYNGDSCLSVYYGLYRLVCLNGLVVGSGLYSAKVRHLQGPALVGALDGLRDSLMNTDLVSLGKNIGKLADSPVSIGDVTDILGQLDLPQTIALQAMRAYLRPSRPGDGGNSAWLAYNRVQEVIASPKRGMAGIKDNTKLMNLFMETLNGKVA
jgi:hypothetical protein